MTVILETHRLYLRTWQLTDVEPYWAINQAVQVIEFLRGPLILEESLSSGSRHVFKYY